MEAIKRIADVKNHRLTVRLPKDFNHPRVEVIILPCESSGASPRDAASAWQRDFLSISCWDEDLQEATVRS